MPHALFLTDTHPPAAPTDNRARLPAAFAAHGWQVTVADHSDLHLRDQVLCAGDLPLSSVHLVWPVGFGPRATFLDRWQLLAHSGARLINPAPAALLLHGKLMWHDLTPETHASANPAVLAAAAKDGGPWVLKPASGSHGRGVRLVEDIAGIAAAMSQDPGMWLLQRYSNAYAAGEHRTLLAGGQTLGCYRRTPHGALQANLAQGGIASAAAITADEQALIDEVARRLADYGVGYASIDTAGTELVEVNVANPGGLATLAAVYGSRFDGRLVQLIEDWLAE